MFTTTLTVVPAHATVLLFAVGAQCVGALAEIGSVHARRFLARLRPHRLGPQAQGAS